MNFHRLNPLIDNPFDGIVPNFDIFGVEFTELWQKALAGVWAICILACAVFLLQGWSRLGKAGASSNPMEVKIARSQIMVSAISLGGVVAIGVLVGAILFFFTL